MIKIQKYYKNELAKVLGGSNNITDMKRKLDRYDVKYTVEGRGEKAIINIESIENPFKVYCITELKIPAGSDFKKILYVYYEFFCSADNEFICLTDYERSAYMDMKKHYVSRQTINTYLGYLNRAGWIYNSNENCRYYLSNRQNRTDITEEKFKEIWRYYYNELENCNEKNEVISKMIKKYGGFPKRHFIPEQSAFYVDKINTFIDIICEQLEKLSHSSNTV